ncbi:uncharacterized protein LOC113566691 [Drosophila persimilis]|uniref:uncharacterized protein LOC113566691 n=1 Tax=Drosophila persimilis TaxID=7234 RepID=UPI000F0998EA|nr:uncharacterized protein LOC113566691 [Drosophila persimilis]
MKKGTYKRQTSTSSSRSLTRSPSRSRSRSRSSAYTFQTSNLELMLNDSDSKVLRPSRHLPHMPHATGTMDNLKKPLPIEVSVWFWGARVIPLTALESIRIDSFYIYSVTDEVFWAQLSRSRTIRFPTQLGTMRFDSREKQQS